MEGNGIAVPWAQAPIATFDDLLGHRIIEMHIWAVQEGLKGASAQALFDGYCQRLVGHGLSLWRAHTVAQTLHPQYSGHGFTWRRDLNAVQPAQYLRTELEDPEWLRSPMHDLVRRVSFGEVNPFMRRRLEGAHAELDFPALADLKAEGATDYFAQIFPFAGGDPSHGRGAIFSFAVNRPGGFADDDIALLKATLPGLSLAMKAHLGHVIASSLLGTYLGEGTARRVHAGAVERGFVEGIKAVLWFADIRGFTKVNDTSAGAEVVELLNDVFEALAAPLRSRGGEVLKFIGDGMLATLAFEEEDRAATCARALDAAAEAMAAIAALNAARDEGGKPAVAVDLALHVGEVLYGNVGAADRLDFTVIGPAVNEASRIEALCEPLGRSMLVSAEFAASAGAARGRLRSLGRHTLRGVREQKEIFTHAF